MLRTKDLFLEEQEKQIFEEQESDELENEAIRYEEENKALWDFFEHENQIDEPMEKLVASTEE